MVPVFSLAYSMAASIRCSPLPAALITLPVTVSDAGVSAGRDHGTLGSFVFRQPALTNPVAVAAARTARNRVRNRVRNRAVDNRRSPSSCRPSHGRHSSSGKAPSPDPMRRPGTSDMRVREEALPGPHLRSVRVRTRPRPRLPGRQCTGEATVWFACQCSLFRGAPQELIKTLRACVKAMKCSHMSAASTFRLCPLCDHRRGGTRRSAQRAGS